jgi:hypothetical protein
MILKGGYNLYDIPIGVVVANREALTVDHLNAVGVT